MRLVTVILKEIRTKIGVYITSRVSNSELIRPTIRPLMLKKG